MEKRTDEMELKAVGTETKEVAKAEKPRRRLNPVAKWVLIGIGVTAVVGGVTFLIVKGKKVPVQAVEKVAEVAGEVAATV